MACCVVQSSRSRQHLSPMDRTSFYFLYVNTNSIVELALQLLAEQMLAQPMRYLSPINQPGNGEMTLRALHEVLHVELFIVRRRCELISKYFCRQVFSSAVSGSTLLPARKRRWSLRGGLQWLLGARWCCRWPAKSARASAPPGRAGCCQPPRVDYVATACM
jgi:hypothetical protein